MKLGVVFVSALVCGSGFGEEIKPDENTTSPTPTVNRAALVPLEQYTHLSEALESYSPVDPNRTTLFFPEVKSKLEETLDELLFQPDFLPSSDSRKIQKQRNLLQRLAEEIEDDQE